MSDCCAPVKDAVILACSGGSNVGQLTNEAAKALDQLGQGRFFCGIGIGAGLPTFIETARNATCVALDGCEVACLKRALDYAGLTPDVYVVVTELGIEKGHHFDLPRDQVAEVAGTVAAALEDLGAGPAGGCGCGG